ncbi:hypothetical protein CASFOL_009329 [Castilleja foliolosa]|uniref:non-specific serine/threonine protein kinase n=1 Tax=Castilleja foliolosa TaxID=1961234 RepID=A0ABD3DWZ5_9LAMI
MMCLKCYNGEKKEVAKTAKQDSIRSPFFLRKMREYGPKFNFMDRLNNQSQPRGHSSPFPNLSSNNLKVFTLSELKKATRNFSSSAKLGEGGFGCVFKGVINSSDDPTKKIDVAIKQLCKRGEQGHKQWMTEVNVLGGVNHPNLVKLIGYCAEDDERGIQRLLVYECMPNGSVADHLSSKSTVTLSWHTRLRIALDAARGLAHLHEEIDSQIIFRDFKSSNILLDEQWNAKLSDFGLARLGPSEGLTHVSTEVAGTMGYAAPEYIRTGHLSSNSDVYSYGVFLYELITGRRPLERDLPRNEQKLLEWIKPYLSDSKKFAQILDSRLIEEEKQILRSALKLSIVANRCLARQRKRRPRMSQVCVMVNEVIEALTVGASCEPRPFRRRGQKRSIRL